MSESQVTAGIIILSLALLAALTYVVHRRDNADFGFWILDFGLKTRRLSRENLRPIPAWTALKNQVAEAVESGRRLYFTLGRGMVGGPAGPTSAAALTALETIATDAGIMRAPLLATVGEATLLPAATDALQRGQQRAGRAHFPLGQALFLAHDAHPWVYGAGVMASLAEKTSDDFQTADVSLMGRLGPEIGLMLEAAERAGGHVIVGTDQPQAMALGWAVTGDVLLGEELFAANAYLQGGAAGLASLQLQDVARWLLALAIPILALLRWLGALS